MEPIESVEEVREHMPAAKKFARRHFPNRELRLAKPLGDKTDAAPAKPVAVAPRSRVALKDPGFVPKRIGESAVPDDTPERQDFFRGLPRFMARADPESEAWKDPEPRELPTRQEPVPPTECAVAEDVSPERQAFLDKLHRFALPEPDEEAGQDWQGPEPRELPARAVTEPRKPARILPEKEVSPPKVKKWYLAPRWSEIIGRALPLKPLGETFAGRKADPETENERSETEGKRSSKRPLIHEREVPREERETFSENWSEIKAESEWERVVEERELARTVKGRLAHSRASGWLFRPGTTRMERTVLAGLASLFLGCGLVALFAWKLGEEDAPPMPFSISAPLSASSVHGGASVELADRAERMIREFYRARSPAEVLRLARHSQTLRPTVEKWMASHPWTDLASGLAVGSASVARVEGRPFLILALEREDRPFREVSLEVTDHGLRIDWETAVGYQAWSWEELRSRRPRERSPLRVRLTRDDYFNFDFEDAGEWQCFRMEHPEQEAPLFGYAPRRSPLALRLSRIADSPSSLERRAVVSARYPERAKAPDLLEIVDLVTEGWEVDYSKSLESVSFATSEG